MPGFTYTLLDGPAGSSMTPDGMFTFTPASDAVATKVHQVVIRAEDQDGNYVSQEFYIGAGTISVTTDSDDGPCFIATAAYGTPLAAVRDMARFLRAAFTGEPVKADYETFRVRYKLEREIPAPPKVMVAALRPKMIELAAAESDGVILNNIAPEDMPNVVSC